MLAHLLLASLIASDPSISIEQTARPLTRPWNCTATASKGQVKIEIRFITVAEDFFERIGVDYSTNPPKMLGSENAGKVGKRDSNSSADIEQPILLNAAQTQKFMENIQSDIRSNIMQAPNMLVASGKKAVIRSMSKQLTSEGKSGSGPAPGYEVCVRPTITADGRAIALDLKMALSTLISDKQSWLSTLSMEDKFILPADHTVLVGGWKQLSEGRFEYEPSTSPLSKIPYVNRLFKNCCYRRSVENVLVMVTARIVPPSAPATDLQTLLTRYHEACTAGRFTEAKQLARQALELDPQCFDVGIRPCRGR